MGAREGSTPLVFNQFQNVLMTLQKVEYLSTTTSPLLYSLGAAHLFTKILLPRHVLLCGSSHIRYIQDTSKQWVGPSATAPHLLDNSTHTLNNKQQQARQAICWTTAYTLNNKE
jgi:hypothetical protein